MIHKLIQKFNPCMNRNKGRWMADSCCVTWNTCTGLSGILNDNEQWTPIFRACIYTRLQTRWHTHCCYGWLNSLSRTLPHSHCTNPFNISTVVMLVFWLCQFDTGSWPCPLCLSSTAKCFVRLFQVNISSLGYGWWCLWFEFHRVSSVPI